MSEEDIKCPECGAEFRVDSKGKQAYELRRKGMAWVDVDTELNCKSSLLLAKFYANINKKPWPIQGLGRMTARRKK